MNASAGFDVLSKEFGEDYLLGKKFGADGDVGSLILAAAEEGGKKEKDNAEAQRTRSERREEVHD